MNSRSECLSRNKSFSLFVFLCVFFTRLCLGVQEAVDELFFVTWTKSVDKWWSLLTPSMSYLWVINWSEKETCRCSRRRQNLRVTRMLLGPDGKQESHSVLSVIFFFLLNEELRWPPQIINGIGFEKGREQWVVVIFPRLMFNLSVSIHEPKEPEFLKPNLLLWEKGKAFNSFTHLF